MESKSHISGKTKKILLGTGIVFGTVLVFIVSFFLSFSLIINPISFVPVGNGELAEENQELKEQIQTLEDEVEVLNTTVERYKNSASETVVVQEPPTVTTPVQSNTNTQQGNTNTQQGGTNNSDDAGAVQEENDFSPETVTTPESGIVPEVEPDITVIDISE